MMKRQPSDEQTDRRTARTLLVELIIIMTDHGLWRMHACVNTSKGEVSH